MALGFFVSQFFFIAAFLIFVIGPPIGFMIDDSIPGIKSKTGKNIFCCPCCFEQLRLGQGERVEGSRLCVCHGSVIRIHLEE